MCKKIVSVITIIAFILFTNSCVSYSPRKTELEKAVADTQKGKKVDILGVVKKSGEQIDYTKKNPGRIVGDRIVVTGSAPEKKVKMELNKADIQDTKTDVRGNVVVLTTRDGTRYYVAKNSYREQDGKVKFTALIQERIADIPLSDVELVYVRKVDPGKTFLTTVGALIIVGAAVAGVIAALKESCPFIYSFDGEQYIFDAEPYGGATCEGLKRTEWCNLEYLQEKDGLYKIMIANEVDETQHTDEIKLLVVDHPKGIQAVADDAGIIHTVSRPIIPSEAYENGSRSLMFYVAENDWIFWKSRVEESSDTDKKNLKDELVFQFPKPAGATEAKILFNGCNTLWASQMVKQFLELYGTDIDTYYENMAAKGPAYHMMMRWNEREELYRLHIRVETEDGWKSKGLLTGGGPFVSEDRIYTIDLTDVPGDTLKIKLTPPRAFWQINYLAVDYSEDMPFEVTELAPLEAYDDNDQDIRETLTHEDGNNLVMPEIGNRALVTFLAVPQKPGMERTYILKASGYYEIHLQSEGECRMDILTRLLAEPGYTIQYSLDQYADWKKENARKHPIR